MCACGTVCTQCPSIHNANTQLETHPSYIHDSHKTCMNEARVQLTSLNMIQYKETRFLASYINFKTESATITENYPDQDYNCIKKCECEG